MQVSFAKTTLQQEIAGVEVVVGGSAIRFLAAGRGSAVVPAVVPA
jgi:hypothetical protein